MVQAASVAAQGQVRGPDVAEKVADARLVPLASPEAVQDVPDGGVEGVLDEAEPARDVPTDRRVGRASGVGGEVDVWITFYTCPPYCATTASGVSVYVGGAACGYGFALGQQFILAGRRYTCNDRGGGPSYWVDIFFWDEAEGWAFIAEVGSYGTVILQ